MWSDRLGTAKRQNLVEQLRGILPAPRAGARAQTVDLGWRSSALEVARGLRSQSGLTWLDQPQPRLFTVPQARLEVSDGEAFISGPGGKLRLEVHGLDLLEAALEAWGGPAEAWLCGYLGYELGLELEDVPRLERRAGDLPDLYLALYDWRVEQRDDTWQLHGTDGWRPAPQREIEHLISTAARQHDRMVGSEPLTSEPTAEGFCAAVARAVKRIYDGELFQVNLCRRLETALPEREAWPLYERLRAINPASHGMYLDLDGGRAVLSASPELFLNLRGGRVRTCPIKGTRPRGENSEEDAALARSLRCSEKDRAELAMIVDVARNDLGRVCEAGTVRVDKHADLMTLPTVHHTYSEVSGLLRPECGVADLLRAGFPPASITGAPKIRAMEVAVEEEGNRRGAAMGAIGWISMAGDLELAVGIRTAQASAGRISYLAGCGITAESVPEQELAESEAKAAAFRRALDQRGFTPAARESARW